MDGTLTPSRKKIEHEFWAPFLIFCRHNDVYLVTGSDRQKTLEQLGLDICYTAKRVYNCSGSDVYEKDKNVYRDDWELPKEVEDFLSAKSVNNPDFQWYSNPLKKDFAQQKNYLTKTVKKI